MILRVKIPSFVLRKPGERDALVNTKHACHNTTRVMMRRSRIQLMSIVVQATAVSPGNAVKDGSTAARVSTETSVVGSARLGLERDMSFGDRGRDVRKLQAFLDVKQTGKFDAATHEAVRSWQRIHDLPQTGYFGKMSRAKAEKLLAEKALTEQLLAEKAPSSVEKEVRAQEAANDASGVDSKPALTALHSDQPAVATKSVDNSLIPSTTQVQIVPLPPAFKPGALSMATWALVPVVCGLLGMTISLATVKRELGARILANLSLSWQQFFASLKLIPSKAGNSPSVLSNVFLSFRVLFSNMSMSLISALAFLSNKPSEKHVGNSDREFEDSNQETPETAGPTKLEKLLQERASQESEMKRKERMSDLSKAYILRREQGEPTVVQPTLSTYVASRPATPGNLAKQIRQVDEYYKKRENKSPSGSTAATKSSNSNNPNTGTARTEEPKDPHSSTSFKFSRGTYTKPRRVMPPTTRQYGKNNPTD